MSFFESLSNNLILSLQIHYLYLEIHKMIHEKYACNDPGNIYLFFHGLNKIYLYNAYNKVCIYERKREKLFIDKFMLMIIWNSKDMITKILK